MKTTVEHKCGHIRVYDWEEDGLKERADNIRQLDCPACAASALIRNSQLGAAFNRMKDKCTHEGYTLKKHGRCCPFCGEFMVDFGD